MRDANLNRMTRETPAAPRPPVAFGCIGAVAFVVVVVLLAVAAVAFFESGANTGKLVLEPAESYGAGSVEFVAARNFYVVRLGDGSFVALSDLDAANRGNAQRRCRVAPLPIADPELPGLVATYAGRMSAKAAGSTLLFREVCNSAVYDVTGVRLDMEAPNLERHPVDIDSAGRLTVDVSKRICTRREGGNPLLVVSC